MQNADNPKMVQAEKDGKVPFEMIPMAGLAAVARVMKSGADKYGRYNFLIDPIRASTYIGSIARHTLLEWAEGVDADADSGEHPLAHVAAACLIVLASIEEGTLIDDRLECQSKRPGEDTKTINLLPRDPAVDVPPGEAFVFAGQVGMQDAPAEDYGVEIKTEGDDGTEIHYRYSEERGSLHLEVRHYADLEVATDTLLDVTPYAGWYLREWKRVGGKFNVHIRGPFESRQAAMDLLNRRADAGTYHNQSWFADVIHKN